MVGYKGGVVGVSGIEYLSKRMRKWPTKYGKKKAGRYLGQVVRMQEEIGTGGAGFRFLYASFLQEAADRLQIPGLHRLAEDMTKIGDSWREFAIEAARIYKGRSGAENYATVADRLYDLSQRERALFTQLGKEIKNI